MSGLRCPATASGLPETIDWVPRGRRSDPQPRMGRRIGVHALLRRPRKDSNLRTRFRKPMLYPLSYGGRRHAPMRGTALHPDTTLRARHPRPWSGPAQQRSLSLSSGLSVPGRPLEAANGTSGPLRTDERSGRPHPLCRRARVWCRRQSALQRTVRVAARGAAVGVRTPRSRQRSFTSDAARVTKRLDPVFRVLLGECSSRIHLTFAR